MVGIASAVTNVTSPQKKNFADFVGSVRTVWAAYATVAVSARDVGNSKKCTARNVTTATVLMQSVTLDTIIAKNVALSASNVKNVFTKTV